MTQSPLDDNSLAAVVCAVQKSKRYGQIDASLISRLATEALAISPGRPAEAIKRTKRKLHQIFGAYVGQPPKYGRFLTRLKKAAEEDPQSLRDQLLKIMAQHASTRERKPILETFYETIFSHTGRPESILDLACGMNPLSALWMNLDHACRYIALDVDHELIGFVDNCLGILGVNHHAGVLDLGSELPFHEAELTLLLKAIPCLDQQSSGIWPELIEAIVSPVIVASFPTKSLGGRGKGMRESYSAQFEQMAAARNWNTERIDFDSELVYIIRK